VQVWWPTYRDVPSTEPAFRAATKSLTAAVDKIEELQVQLCLCLLDFVPSPPLGPETADTTGPPGKEDKVEASPSASELQESQEERRSEAAPMSRSNQGDGSLMQLGEGRSGIQNAEGVDTLRRREEAQQGQVEVAGGRWAGGTEAGMSRQSAERRAGPEGGASTSARGGQGSTGAGASRAKKAEGLGNGQTEAPTREPLLRGGAFKHFLLRLVKKNKGVNRNVPPPGLSDNSVLVSVYFALLRILLDGCDAGGGCGEGRRGLLSRRGVRSFPVEPFLQSHGHYSDLSRLGGLFSHLTKELPWAEVDKEEVFWLERNGEVISPVDPEAGRQSISEAMDVDEREGLLASSGLETSTAESANPAADGVVCDDIAASSSVQAARTALGSMSRSAPTSSSAPASVSRPPPCADSAVREEELLDVLVLLYNLGIASNFKQASHFLQNQMHNMAQLDETDRQLAAARQDQQRTLREVRAVFLDDVAENARWSAWWVDMAMLGHLRAIVHIGSVAISAVEDCLSWALRSWNEVPTLAPKNVPRFVFSVPMSSAQRLGSSQCACRFQLEHVFRTCVHFHRAH
jgi:hypothetical protein